MRTRYGTRSVYWRLLLVYGITCVLIFLIAGAGIRYAVKPRVILKNAIVANVQAYINSLIRQIGSPPDIRVAADLCKRLDLDIQIWGPDMQWHSRPGLPSLKDYRQYKGRFIEGFNAGRIGTRLFYLETRENIAFAVSVSNGPIQWIHYEMGAVALLMILTVLGGSFLLLRLLLKPLTVLVSGIIEVGRGNFNYRIRAGNRDEFAEIGEVFNRMAGQVREMVAQKEQLLVDVSHELRTPLTRIRLALETNSSNREAVRESIVEDVRELNGMIQELLESSRIDALHGQLRKEPVLCNDLIQDVLDDFSRDRHRISFEPMESRGAGCHVDAARMKILLRNLIENALKYTAVPSTIVEILVRQSGSGIEFRVSDHGRGVPDSEKERIFEAFYRMDASRTRDTGGVGIGLNLCRKIAAAHGGTIHVEDTPGGGASFVVRIP